MCDWILRRWVSRIFLLTAPLSIADTYEPKKRLPSGPYDISFTNFWWYCHMFYLRFLIQLKVLQQTTNGPKEFQLFLFLSFQKQYLNSFIISLTSPFSMRKFLSTHELPRRKSTNSSLIKFLNKLIFIVCNWFSSKLMYRSWTFFSNISNGIEFNWFFASEHHSKFVSWKKALQWIVRRLLLNFRYFSFTNFPSKNPSDNIFFDEFVIDIPLKLGNVEIIDSGTTSIVDFSNETTLAINFSPTFPLKLIFVSASVSLTLIIWHCVNSGQW